MKFHRSQRFAAAMMACCLASGCDRLPEAFSGKPDPNTQAIQAVGPTSDSEDMAAVTPSAPMDLASLQNDPNLKTIDASIDSMNGQIPATLINQSTITEESLVDPSSTPGLTVPPAYPADETSTGEVQLDAPQEMMVADPAIATSPGMPHGDGVVVVEFANLKFIDDTEVIAPADGMITSLAAQEGDWIEENALLVELDTRLAKAELEVANQELTAARQKSEDKSEIQYAKAAQEVAKQDLDNSAELVSKRVESQGDYRKKWLEHRRAELAITVAEIKRNQDLSVVKVNEAKKNAAEVQIDIRSIEAPFRGIVAEKQKDVHDWVKAGDIVLRLVSLDTLRVVGMVRVDSLESPPHLLVGAPASIDIQLYPGAVEKVEGKVGFVSPVMQSSGAYKFWIEIPNRKVNDQWLFREGMTATIHINTRH